MKTKSFLRLPVLLAVLLPATIFSETKPHQNDRHIVIVVWDGMRPDFISEQTTPTLWKLAREGVTFRRHHSVYPTLTNVNGTALATGVFPNRNGLLANREYRPQIDPEKPFENGQPTIIKKGDETTGGKYLAAATVAEIVRAAGRRTAIAGTKSVTFLHDRHAEWTSAVSKNSITRFAAAPISQDVRETMLRLLGPFRTEPVHTSNDRNAYATRALTEILWRDGLPAYSVLWLSEPDLTQHDLSPGAEPSLAAIQASDKNLAAVVAAVTQKNARETTDFLIVSDHGFSTVERSLDFVRELRTAGFEAVSRFEQIPKVGQIMIVGNGGTILFYVIEHDRTVVSRLVEWLQHSDFAGVIFAREKFEGVFPLESINANTSDAPDVMVALRWNPKPNRFKIPGQIITDTSHSAGEGSHGTLSEFDVHNILIAAGPDFRRAMSSDIPSGNIDLARTVLRLLELEAPHKLDGRVLSEAMTGDSTSPPLRAVTETREAVRKFPSGAWRQHLRTSRVGETTYIDEGNGTFEAR